LVETDVDISYGNSIYVTGLRGSNNGFVNIGALEKVDVHCVDTSKIAIGLGTSADANTYQNTKIGTARVKNFIRYAADPFNAVADSNGAFKLYLSDIDMRPIVTTVASESDNAKSITLPTSFSALNDAYVNVAVTVLPVRLDALSSIANANISTNKFIVQVASPQTLDAGSGNKKVNVGDIVRINNEVREVVNIANDNAFVVNTEFTSSYTSNSAAGFPLQIFKQTSYSSSVTNQTRLITNYNGSTKKATLDREFDDGAKVGGAVPNSTSVVQFNFKLDHAESFIAGPIVANNQATVSNSSMNVSAYSKYLTGETSTEDTLKQSLVFRLPRTYAKRGSINNCDYVHNKIIPERPPTSTGSGIFQIAGGQGLTTTFETLPWADSTSAIQDNLIVVVRDRGSETGVSNGDILQLDAGHITKTNDSLSINTGLTGLKFVDIIVSVKQNDAEDKIRRKVLHSNTEYTLTSFNYPTTVPLVNVTIELRTSAGNIAYGNVDTGNGLVFITSVDYTTVRPGDSISLYVPDVVRVRKVIAGNSTMLPNATVYTDITDHFYVDYGQRDDRYEHAKLILKDGYDSPSAKLLVHVDYYEHIYATGSNVSFFSVDSYTQEEYENGTIPIYTSSTGVVYNLRDCLDFRPTQILGDGDEKYTVPAIPSPDETTELSYDYYLPRIDKLVLSKDKEFRVIKGKSAPQPLPPADSDEAMTLYTLYLPPYVADVREVRLKYNENKRYTMKDISQIDKRLERVEYFTSLNNVEKLAMADKTQYEDGTEKEKYGLVGENFKNFNIADYKSTDFNVALEGGFMIPAMKVYSLGLKPVGKENTTVNKKTVCLSYTEVPAITQSLASDKAISVQPFLFGQFNGAITLTPETDVWVSETLKPEVITVPERIVETVTIIREKVIEPSPPATLPPPKSNADVVIVKNPGTDLPPTTDDDTVIIVPDGPDRPVIPEDPVPPTTTLPDLPSFPEFILEYDPWFRISPLNFGVNFTFGATGYSAGNLFSNGGLFDDSKWVPAVTEFTAAVEPDVVFESTNPTKTPQIVLANGGRGAESGGGGGGRFDDIYDYDKV
jgi:hypothetical protein